VEWLDCLDAGNKSRCTGKHYDIELLRNYHGANKIDGYMRILGGSQHFLRSSFNGWNIVRYFEGHEDVVER